MIFAYNKHFISLYKMRLIFSIIYSFYSVKVGYQNVGVAVVAFHDFVSSHRVLINHRIGVLLDSIWLCWLQKIRMQPQASQELHKWQFVLLGNA